MKHNASEYAFPQINCTCSPEKRCIQQYILHLVTILYPHLIQQLYYLLPRQWGNGSKSCHNPKNVYPTLTFSPCFLLGKDGQLFLEFCDVYRLFILVLGQPDQFSLLSEPELLKVHNFCKPGVDRLLQRVDVDFQGT